MESLARDLNEMQRQPLAASHVRRIRAAGTERTWKAGEMVQRVGDPADVFIYVTEGEVEVLDPLTGENELGATLGATQFIGEITFLQGGRWYLDMRAVQDTTGIVVERKRMLDLMREVPEMSDHIITVFAARRRRTLESGDTALTIVGAEEDRNLRRIAAFAGRNRIPVRSYALGSAEAAQMAEGCGAAPGTPFAVFGKDHLIKDPSPRAVASLLGIDLSIHRDDVDVLIVGGGPAGVSAGVYAGAEGLSALVVEDLTIGGQAGTSSRIENYMGFPTGISGADLCWRGEVQAMKFGTRFAVPRRAAGIEKRGDGRFCVTLEDGDVVCAKAVVIATGVQYRKLPIDRLEHFEGAGIYYAATDVEARFCRGQEVAVIGGGNSAGQAAMFLSRSTKHVHVLVRGESLADSMSDYLLSRLEKDPAITIHYCTEMTALHGEETLEAITIRDRSTGDDWKLNTRAVFVMVGAAPNTDWLGDCVQQDSKGFVCTGLQAGAQRSFETNVPGIFAVGDLRAGSVKRVASSVGEGSVVISQVWDYLENDAPAYDTDEPVAAE